MVKSACGIEAVHMCFNRTAICGCENLLVNRMVKGVCILSYRHEILHKDVFGYALSYLNKRQAQLFQYGRQIQDGSH